MSDVEHTYVDTNNGFGGPALGAGFGGLIGSWFGQGMNGNGFGGGNNNTYVANQLSAIQSQAVSNGLKSKVNILEQTQSIVNQLKTTGATG